MKVRNNERTSRKLKVEEFPDLVAIIEYEFGEGDNRDRGAGDWKVIQSYGRNCCIELPITKRK